MHKHIQNEHAGDGENITFNWKVIGTFQKPLTRQLFEAIHIDKKANNVNLNSKCEYFKHNIQKIGMTEGEYQCNYCGRVFRMMSELKIHEKSVHTRFQCKQCKYLSFGEIDLTHHLKSQHNNTQSGC